MISRRGRRVWDASVKSYSRVICREHLKSVMFHGVADELNLTRSFWFGYLFRDSNMEISA